MLCNWGRDGMVDMRDLKSLSVRSAGSSPAAPTNSSKTMFRYYYKDCFTYAGFTKVFNYEIWDRQTNRRIGAVHEIDDALKIVDSLNDKARIQTNGGK